MAGNVQIERSPFDPAAVSAETAEFNARLEAMLAGTPPPQTLPPEVTRRAREEGRGLFGPVVRSDLARDQTIAGVPCRVLLPETVQGVYLHIHGGGWTLGRAHHADARN